MRIEALDAVCRVEIGEISGKLATVASRTSILMYHGDRECSTCQALGYLSDQPSGS
jgi:hypothetical protein